MRHKKLHLCAVLLLVLGLGSLQAQSVYVNSNNGSVSGYALKNIQSIHFSSGDMHVVQADNDTDDFDLSDLRHLTFTEETISVDEHLADEDHFISIYPNPVEDVLSISNKLISEDGTIRIYTIGGELILTQKIGKQPLLTIDVSDFAEGAYLCKYSNANRTETIKFIKQ